MSKTRKSLRYGKRQPRQPAGIRITLSARNTGKNYGMARELEARLRENPPAVMMLSCPPVFAHDLRRMADQERLLSRYLIFGMDPASPGGDWSPDTEQLLLSKLARHSAPDRLPRAVDFIPFMRPWDEAALLSACTFETPPCIHHAMKDDPQNPGDLPDIDLGKPDRGHVVAAICVLIFAASFILGILFLASL